MAVRVPELWENKEDAKPNEHLFESYFEIRGLYAVRFPGHRKLNIKSRWLSQNLIRISDMSAKSTQKGASWDQGSAKCELSRNRLTFTD